jgi:hypothetical protein
MKNIFKSFGVAVTIMVFLLIGCDNDPEDTDVPDVSPGGIIVDVMMNSSSPDVLRGGEVTFLVRVLNTTDRAVTWSIDEDNRHQDTKLEYNANSVMCLSVSEDETLQKLTIRATSNADPEKSGTVTVTIPVPSVESVEISQAELWVSPWEGKVDVGPDGEIEFTVKVTGKDFIREAVSWSIDNAAKKSGTKVDVDEKGVAHLKVAADESLLTSFKVQAVSKWDTSKKGEVTVTVKEPIVKSVVILDSSGIEVVSENDVPEKRIRASSSENFRAIVTGTGKVNQSVTWKIARKTYLLHQVMMIQQDSEGRWTDGWGSDELVIDLENELPIDIWVLDEEAGMTNLAWIYKKSYAKRLEDGKIEIELVDAAHKSYIETLIPINGTTGIDQTGKFTVDGIEWFGNFRLIAAAAGGIERNVIVEIVSSMSGNNPNPPPEF